MQWIFCQSYAMINSFRSDLIEFSDSDSSDRSGIIRDNTDIRIYVIGY